MWSFKKKDKKIKTSTLDKIDKHFKQLKECYPMGIKIKYMNIDMIVCGYSSHVSAPLVGLIYNVELKCDYVNSRGELKNAIFSYDEAMNENTALVK